MKILQVISYFYPAFSYGGPGKLVYELSESLVKHGHQVSVFTTDAFNKQRRRRDSDNQDLRQSKLNVYFFKNLSNFLAFDYKLFFPIDCLLAIVEKVKSFDVIHTHEFFTPLNLFCALASSFHKVPYVLSPHGTLSSFHLEHRKKIKNVFMNFFGKKILAQAERLIDSSGKEEVDFLKLGVSKNKISYIQNGINILPFDNLPKIGLFRQKYKIGKRQKIVTYLGRINKLKGLNILVEAFIKLQEEFDILLVIAGSDDGYLVELKQLVSNLKLKSKIIFPGAIFGQEKLKLYADTDIFVYPSPSEGFSIAILEAAASGIPVVITDGCHFPHVDKYKAGQVVKFDSNSLIEALRQLIVDDSLRKQACQNAKKMIYQNFTIDIMVNKMGNLYEQIKKRKS